MKAIFAVALLVSVGSGVLSAQTSSAEAIYAFARTLAGTEVEPVCRVDRDPTDQMAYTDKCVWTFNAASKPESLTVGRDENNVALLAWDHVVGDDDGIRLFLDKLMPFISSNNLRMHKCEDGATPAGRVESTLWSSATYWALFSRIRNDTLPTRVVFTLTDDTGNLRGKKVLCKETGSLGPQAPTGTILQRSYLRVKAVLPMIARGIEP